MQNPESMFSKQSCPIYVHDKTTYMMEPQLVSWHWRVIENVPNRSFMLHFRAVNKKVETLESFLQLKKNKGTPAFEYERAQYQYITFHFYTYHNQSKKWQQKTSWHYYHSQHIQHIYASTSNPQPISLSGRLLIFSPITS